MSAHLIRGIESFGDFLISITEKQSKASDPSQYRSAGKDSAASHYNLHIAPFAFEYENKRFAAVQEVKSRLYYSVAAVIFLISVFIIFGQNAHLLGLAEKSTRFSGLPMWVFIGTVVLLGWWTHEPARQFYADVRGEIYPRMFMYFGADFKHHITAPESITEDIVTSKIAPYHTYSNISDYVTGSHNGVGIELAELELSRRNGKHGTKIVFDGLAVALTPKRKFDARIIIDQDAGALMNKLSGLLSFGRVTLRRVKLEDPTFEQLFEVYSDDQIGARTVLTTSFMQRMVDMSRKHHLDKLSCSFHDGKILFMLPTGVEHFPPLTLFRPVDLEYQFRQIVNEMQLVFGIIDDLKLDQDIGL
ncbi:MAG: DUF3137 domain-containing protein [Alphaproteobacteria bacterium]|nr:DUF3137 domain-containing protein [Alphaproteobacteria bacterium]